MKQHRYSLLLFLMIMCIGTSFSQINLNANAGGGVVLLDGDTDHYFPGYRFSAGLTIDGPIPITNDLSWEVGLETAFAQSRFYRMKRSDSDDPIVVIGGEVPLDRSVKYTHSFWFLDVPARIRYNAFGFMGLMAGMNLSFRLARQVYHPDLDQFFEDFYDNNMIATAEAGLFFPVTDRIRIDVKGYKALDGRFYLSRSRNKSGEIVKGNPYSDFGFLVNVAYKLNRSFSKKTQ
ncbi:hypothetical protein KUV50_12200 [Membranicola marinus]|uniref:Outer membrane protein beta-barrel domain-containing protein n=1 Tax=Membranihabitans marinus TaxID=1227546 RepID=A0A953LDI2_9BACT|nr:hypothetical protein [Membranihabitans marinus]MBY5958904.1 hypothetical protein [Membranihabitans marinus]